MNLYVTGDFALLKLTLVLLCMKKISITRTIKFDLIIRIIFIVFMQLLLKLGIATDLLSYNDGFYKHSLGFTNPNAFGMHLFIVFAEFIFLNWNSKGYFLIFCLTIFMLIINQYIGCRTVIACMGILIILKIIYNLNPDIYNKKFLRKLIINSFTLFTIITTLFALLYYFKVPIGIEINTFLSNRLYNIVLFYKNYDLTLFGVNMDLNTTFDTFYAYSFLSYGVINTLIILLGTKKLFRKLYEKRYYSLLIIMLVFSIYGFSERVWFLIDYNIFMIMYSILIFNKNIE